MSNEYWIVTSYAFVKQPSREIAEGERDRLAARHPEKEFRVLRVKRSPDKSRTTRVIEAARALADLEDGLLLYSSNGVDKMNELAAALAELDAGNGQ